MFVEVLFEKAKSLKKLNIHQYGDHYIHNILLPDTLCSC